MNHRDGRVDGGPLAVGWLAFDTGRCEDVNDRLGDQVHAAQFQVETLLSTLKDAETGERGCLLTGKSDA